MPLNNFRIAELEESEKGKDEMIEELRNDIDQLSKKVVLDLKAALEAVKNEAQLEKTEVSLIIVSIQFQLIKFNFYKKLSSYDLLTSFESIAKRRYLSYKTVKCYKIFYRNGVDSINFT